MEYSGNPFELKFSCLLIMMEKTVLLVHPSHDNETLSNDLIYHMGLTCSVFASACMVLEGDPFA